MNKQTRKKLISWTSQCLIFVAIFVLITWWQQKDMLSTGSAKLAPSFSLVSTDEKVIEFRPEQQTNTTLIYFFAPWCGVCHASIDNIESIKQSANGKIQFYVIALDWSSRQDVERFLSEHQLSVPVLYGTDQTQIDFKVRGFPSYYIIDQNGRLQSKDLGYTTELGMRMRLGLASF